VNAFASSETTKASSNSNRASRFAGGPEGPHGADLTMSSGAKEKPHQNFWMNEDNISMRYVSRA